MRWEKKYPKEYNVGDVVIKKKFAFLPITVRGQVRWLEFVKIKYELINDSMFTIFPNYVWVAREFIDDERFN